MNFTTFTEKVVRTMKADFQNAEVTVREVLKPNGLILHSLNIMENDRTCTPNIYLDTEYDLMQRKGLSLDESCRHIKEAYSRAMNNLDNMRIFEDLVDDFSKASSRLTIKLLNRDMNRELLEDVDYIPLLDLAGVPYIADDLGKMSALVKVSRDLSELWQTDAEKIHGQALDNLRRYGRFSMRDIREIIFGETSLEVRKRKSIGPPMYVMSDGSGQNGSSALLLPDILAMAADELDDDIFLLPSSVHELIIMKAADSDPEELKRTVANVNRRVVATDEILSYSVYMFSRSNAEVTVAA